MYKARNTSKTRYFWGAAFVSGLAFSTKWTGGLFLIVLEFNVLLFIFFESKNLTITKKALMFIGSLFLFFFGFSLGTPFFILDFPNASAGLIQELSKPRHHQIPPFQAIPQTLQILVRGIGVVPTIIGFITFLTWTIFRSYSIALKWKNKKPW
ncbi:MAG: hypothetical protein ACFFDN_32070, partial [Candidatus Hodarchaeota archaeon]